MRRNFTRLTASLCFMLIFTACGPAIRYFVIVPQTITAGDSVKINWSVRGKPTMLLHIDSAVISGDDPHPEYREFTLVSQKGKKEKRSFIQVIVLPEESEDDIVFSTIRKGDSLFATGEKNEIRWGTLFLLKTISSGSGRTLQVSHGGKTVVLDKEGSGSVQFAGIPNSGEWEIRTAMSDREKADSTTIPAKLTIHSIILHQKQ
jgi:hypothetical protein